MSTKVCVLLFFCICHVSFAEWMANESFSIDYVLRLGHAFDEPVLQLLGKGFVDTAASLNAELREREKEIVQEPQGKETFFTYVCHLMACGKWSEWSECPDWPGLYTLTQRTRQCGLNTTLCTYPSTWTETEEDGCGEPSVHSTHQRTCPSSFEVINGYCLWYNSNTGSKQYADDQCAGAGGHLANINTLARSNAIDQLLRNHGYSGTIYIDGQRPSSYSPHQYRYGADPTFDDWAGGEPSGGSSEMCKVQEGSSTRTWWDRECSNSYRSVCEIFLSN